MEKYWVHAMTMLRLTLRDKMALFFTYMFPLLFFFLFGTLMDGGEGPSVAKQLVAGVLVLGVLGNGFFGAGLRAVIEREQGILRRFKVAPAGPGPFLFSSLFVGLLNYIPSVLLMVVMGHFVYKMPWPERPISLILFLCLGLLAFRGIGLIIASVVNSMQESQILIQSLYMPMLFLSGATFPISFLPKWLQQAAQFLPSTHLFNGMQSILLGQQPIWMQWREMVALVTTLVVSIFLAWKLFRWEKEEKVKPSAKLWLLTVLLPFLGLGGYQLVTEQNVDRQQRWSRQLRRDASTLISGVRLVGAAVGPQNEASVLVQNGRIAAIYPGTGPDPKTVGAEAIAGAGKTLMPGLLDMQVTLLLSGGLPDEAKATMDTKAAMQQAATVNEDLTRRLGAYLYSGVVGLRSTGDTSAVLHKAADKLEAKGGLAPKLYVDSPMVCAPNSSALQALSNMPAALREMAGKMLFRFARAPEDVAAIVNEAKDAKQNLLRLSPEAMTVETLARFGQEARRAGILLVAVASKATDVEKSFVAAPAWVESGAHAEEWPDSLLAQMATKHIAYLPSLASAEAEDAIVRRDAGVLSRPLVQQAMPRELLEATRKRLEARVDPSSTENAGTSQLPLLLARVAKAKAAGVTLLAGSGGGHPLVPHGPMLHRELQLLVQAGLTPGEAIAAATSTPAKLLGVAPQIAVGSEATLLLVDGNPLEDIRATERISLLLLKGERVSRAALLHKTDE